MSLLYDTNKGAYCPECQIPVSAEGTVPSQSGGGSAPKPQEEPSVCPNCDVRKVAVQCVECGPMCKECSSQIHSVKIFQNHSISPISQDPLRNSRKGLLPEHAMCSQHNEEKKLFCQLCKCMVCHFCLLVGSHRDPDSGTPHPCSPIDDAMSEAKSMLQSRVRQSTEAINLVKTSQGVLQASTVAVTERLTIVQSEIVNHFALLETLLRSRRDALISELIQRTSRQKQTIDAQKRKLAVAADQYRDVRESLDSMLRSNDVHVVVENYVHLLYRLEDIEELFKSLQPASNSTFEKFGFGAERASDGIFANIGHLLFDSENTTTIREGSMVSSLASPRSLAHSASNEPVTVTPPVTALSTTPFHVRKLSVNVTPKSTTKSSTAVVPQSNVPPQGRKLSVQSIQLDRISFGSSSIQLIDSSPDVLHVGSEGMMRFQLHLLSESHKPLSTSNLEDADISQIRESLWVESIAGDHYTGQNEVVIQGEDVLMMFMPTQTGEHFLKTTIGSFDGSPLPIAAFSVEASLAPVPSVTNAQKGLDVSNISGMRTLKRTGPGWRVANLDHDFATEKKETVFSWQIRVDELPDPDGHPHKGFIGVSEVGVPTDTLCSLQTLNTDYVWGVYLASGKKVRKDKELKIVQGVRGFQPGDIVGILIEIDREKSQMSVYKNGKLQGLAFRAMPRDTRPVIGLTGNGIQVSIVAFTEGSNAFLNGT